MKFLRGNRVKVIGGTSKKLKGKCGNVSSVDKVGNIEFYGVSFNSINEYKMFKADELELAKKYER